ncbi:hypothetical protein Tco_1017901 [Tanacetum coccineum]|uniref:Uncharacterized protein n=1 Tax=Tanacetum coccineum TaxID=301880 RepID=A0ABQ5FSV2_9ASTR
MKDRRRLQWKRFDTSVELDASSVIIESNGTESQKQDTSSRSGNDAEIRPIYDEEPMAEIQKKGFAIAALKNELRKIKPWSSWQMTSVHISSGLVPHQMTSDHNLSELGIHDHNNEQSSSKLVPKVFL